MTQPDELQQAYDRAMAHNAMLRDTIVEMHNNLDFCDIQLDHKVTRVLNATEADATAWEKVKHAEWQNEMSSLAAKQMLELMRIKQQLATVTQERDALRENITKAAKEVKHELFVWSVEFNGLLDMTHGVDDAYSYPQLEARINNLLTLAQSPPSE